MVQPKGSRGAAKWRCWYFGLMLAASPLALPAFAEGPSNEDLAKQTQNPVAALISVPFQNNTNFGVGPKDQTQNVLNIQPVVPVSLTEDINLINRAIAPIIWQPNGNVGNNGDFGLGDITYTAFFSPVKPFKSIIWGAGPIISLPTAVNSRLGAGKFSMGPSVVALTTIGPWVGGALVNNLWSVAGNSDRATVNQMLLQPFINYNFGKTGWSASTAPILTANWRARGSDVWTVPVGGGFGKVFRIGAQPINAGIQGYWNAATPGGGPDTTLRITVAFLFPK